MGMRGLTWLALSGVQLLGASAAVVEKRQDIAHKYCPGGTSICFSEAVVNDLIFRIAIPDAKQAPFEILFQIVAPISVGWAALGWGGKMANNPITLGWANGNGIMVSSRWTSGHTQPQPYTGASYQVLPSAHTNATHWHLDVLCTGCSTFGSTSLNPNGANTLAWAKSSKSVQTPSSNTTIFGYHDARGTFSHDFSTGKIPQGVFDALVYDLGNQNGANTVSRAPSQSTVVNQPSASVVTDVTTADQPRPPITTTNPVITSVVTLPHTPSSSGVDSPITTPRPISSATPTQVTIWVTQPPDGPPVTFTQPGNGPGGGVVTVTVTSTLVPGSSATPGPLGPWGAGPPPWASPGATPPWGTWGPPPWVTAGAPPVIPVGKGKGWGKGKFRPPAAPAATEPVE